MQITGRPKHWVKHLRASQPCNWLATSALRGVMAATGLRSELVVKHVHRVGHVRARLPNGKTLRLWSRGDDWVSNQVFWRGWDGYEPETTRVFFRLAERAEAVLDIGAYVGFYALLAGHANFTARVFAFEPLSTIFQRLDHHIQLNKLTNVTCINKAVGAQSGAADFYHMDAELPTSSSLSYGFMQHVESLQWSQVEVIALDEFVEERGIRRIDLVKIDTESTEPEVLRGMRNTLRRDRPNIVCEVLQGRGSEKALQEILQPLGYRFYLLTPNGPESRGRVVAHPEWLNYLFSVRSVEALFPPKEATSPVAVRAPHVGRRNAVV